MERFADVARILIVGQGIRGTHDRSRIERRVVTERLGDNAEMFVFRAVERHMSAGHQRVKRPWRRHSIGEPQSSTAAAVGVSSTAVTVTRRPAIVPIDKCNRFGGPAADQGCAVSMQMPEKRPWPGVVLTYAGSRPAISQKR